MLLPVVFFLVWNTDLKPTPAVSPPVRLTGRRTVWYTTTLLPSSCC